MGGGGVKLTNNAERQPLCPDGKHPLQHDVTKGINLIFAVIEWLSIMLIVEKACCRLFVGVFLFNILSLSRRHIKKNNRIKNSPALPTVANNGYELIISPVKHQFYIEKLLPPPPIMSIIVEDWGMGGPRVNGVSFRLMDRVSCAVRRLACANNGWSQVSSQLVPKPIWIVLSYWFVNKGWPSK